MRPLLIFVLWFCVVVWAQNDNFISGETDGFTVERWVTKFMAKSDREFLAYHWVKRESVGSDELGFGINPTGPIDPRDPKVSRHVEDWSQYYFKSLKHGLYLGTDPVYYRSFGGENFLLYRVRMHVGLRFLDFHTHFGDKQFSQVPAEARQELQTYGCDCRETTEWEELFRGEGYSVKESPGCAKVVFDTIRKLKVDVIKYRKGAVDFESCPGEREKFAMILVNTASLMPADIAYFYSEMASSELQEEQIQIERLFLNVKVENRETHAYYQKMRPWPQLDEESARASDSILVNILGCQ